MNHHNLDFKNIKYMIKNNRLVVLGLMYLIVVFTGCKVNSGSKAVERTVYRIDAGDGKINHQVADIVTDDRLDSKKGVTLKPGVSDAIDGERAEPDVTFNIRVSKPGRYVMTTFAVTDSDGTALMQKAKSKFESLFMRIQIGDQRPTKRVVYVPWDLARPVSKQASGKFGLSGEEQELKIWLPRGVRLGHIELASYVPPAVPTAAQGYRPKIVPPSGHPRLWLNEQSLPVVKSRLNQGENRAKWEKVKELALTPFDFAFVPDAEVSYNDRLEKAAEAKAFYYLMTGDKKTGDEAIRLMVDYMSHVEFGNILDITREIGRAIYTASEVYDWCYHLLDEKDREILYKNMMRLADDMECGWPPFKQSIINGHGSEAQVNRDLLSMSIAIYNEDPLPYQYTSYEVLEQLVPMRRFEYQSPRHNQGVDYGAYRFAWEMHAAWIFRRMNDNPVFDDNIREVRKFWQYMRIPDGQMLRDGDGFSAGPAGEFYYWKSPLTMFMNYTYSSDPVLKAEFERQGGISENPILFLLLNDPGLQAESSMESLPLTMNFGPVLGSMVARTGWHIGMNSNDVVAEIKGGGYHFGNHQHADAGSIQLYYRGFQFGDLGEYVFYGTPYDMNFNKRSISHSMMLAVDPGEKFGNIESNDGGTRYNQRNPRTPHEAQTDPQFNNGRVLSGSFGPSVMRPAFSYFQADLTKAYSSKMKAYTRGFCFLNLGKEDIPAAIILTDDMTTANPEFKKYWQINAYNMPEKTDDGVILQNQREGLVGKTHVKMLIPAPADRQMEILSGEDANSVFGHKYEPPKPQEPEAHGHRIMISPKKASENDRFLTIFQMVAGDTRPLPVSYEETPVSYVVTLADRVVSMSKGNDFISNSFELKIPAGGKYQVALTGMKPGVWNIKSRDGKVNFTAEVKSEENTIFFEEGSGDYIVAPASY